MNDAQLLDLPTEEGALSFARRFVRSEAFMLLFREGMGLVEQTASYLDGDGRKDAAALPREVALSYATESMRLTTRLMQLASWLLTQRAVAEGELTAEQARTEQNKVRIGEPMGTPAEHIVAQLPQRLLDLMAHAGRLQARVRHLESQMNGTAAANDTANPVQNQLANLQARLGMAW
jgi:regulator of CtrA degradation